MIRKHHLRVLNYRRYTFDALIVPFPNWKAEPKNTIHWYNCFEKRQHISSVRNAANRPLALLLYGWNRWMNLKHDKLYNIMRWYDTSLTGADGMQGCVSVMRSRERVTLALLLFAVVMLNILDRTRLRTCCCLAEMLLKFESICSANIWRTQCPPCAREYATTARSQVATNSNAVPYAKRFPAVQQLDVRDRIGGMAAGRLARLALCTASINLPDDDVDDEERSEMVNFRFTEYYVTHTF